MPETSTASGRSAQSRTVWSPTPSMTTEPATTPSAVPVTARTAVAPVPSALDRSTDSVPSTTQKPCETLVISMTATARASPMAPRTALRNQTERKERWESSRCRVRVGDGLGCHPHPPIQNRLGACRLERRVGDHLGGDAERPRVEPGVERAGQALVPDRFRPGGTGYCAIRMRRRFGQRRHVGLELRTDEPVEPARRILHRSNALGIVDRVRVAVADESRRLPQRLRHALRDRPRRGRLRRPVLVGDQGRVTGDPLDAAHQLGERERSRRSTRRRVGRPRELLAQARQLGRDGRLRLRIGRVAGAGVGEPRHGRDGRRQPAPEVVVPWGRPDHEAGGDAERAGQGPAHQAGTNGGRRAATATERTNVSNAAVAALATWGATMPTKSTANPTRPMATTAVTFWVDTTVPSAMKQPPATKRPA